MAIGRGMGVSKAGLPDGAPSPMGKMDMREVHTVKADTVVREMHREVRGSGKRILRTCSVKEYSHQNLPHSNS